MRANIKFDPANPAHAVSSPDIIDLPLFSSPQVENREVIADTKIHSFALLCELIQRQSGLPLSFHDLSGITSLIAELNLPNELRSHNTAFCRKAKSSRKGFTRCVRVKRCANFVSLRRKQPFCAACPLGVFDLVYPVFMDDQLLGIFFFGNLPISQGEKPVAKMRREAERRFEKYRPMMDLAASYVLNAVRARGITPETLPCRKNSSTHWLTQLACEFIHAHYEQPVSLNIVAKSLHVRSEYLSRVFSREMNIPITGYLHQCRIHHAQEYLRQTNDTVTEIAMRIGYNDSSYFSRRFQKVVGCSPRAYRRRFRNTSS